MAIYANAFTKFCGKIIYKAGKKAPTIMMIAGVVGTVAGTVYACSKMRKASDIVDKAADKLDIINVEEAELNESTGLTYEEKKNRYAEIGKEKFSVVIDTAGKLVKVFAGPTLVLATSIASIFGGYKVLNGRYLATLGELATVTAALKNEHKNLREMFGDEEAWNIIHNVSKVDILDDDGNLKATVTTPDPNTFSDYSRVWECGNTGWSKDPTANLFFLKKTQSMFNDRLKEDAAKASDGRGFLTLKEVYEYLNFPVPTWARFVGWVYDEKCPVGDNFVDFGLYNLESQASVNFINGYETNVLLDFNVDGDIRKYMWDDKDSTISYTMTD